MASFSSASYQLNPKGAPYPEPGFEPNHKIHTMIIPDGRVVDFVYDPETDIRTYAMGLTFGAPLSLGVIYPKEETRTQFAAHIEQMCFICYFQSINEKNKK
jgi:hypothetical protein